MFLLFIAALFLIAFGIAGLQFLLKLRTLQSAERANVSSLAADRYRPMLRLLADDDLQFVANDKKLQSTLRARRRSLFRGYLRCLTRDYAALLDGVRDAMVRSGIDRPDLARALARNRVLFALAICKVEFRLMIHATGAGQVDISGLVEAVEALRTQVNLLSRMPLPV
jgi:hypothetical protein